MVRSLQLDIRPDLAGMVTRAVSLWEQWAAEAIADHGYFAVALSGGSTPKPLFQALVKADLPWDKLYVVWGDERFVPADHPDSNFLMAQQALLAHVPIPAERIFPFPTEIGDPTAAAAAYAQTLQDLFQGRGEDQSLLDCNLMGVGDDGHTASLFPGTAALQAPGWVTTGNKGDEPRLTLTYHALNRSEHVLMMVQGAAKATIMQQVLEQPSAHLPSQAIQPSGDLIWLLDRAAAAQLALAQTAG